ncbi:hypothetical protein [Segetibacter aerophilus]|uniref:Uncharacterized protein n=1 Tax=Segetibacter aerophilus TaxID=670293 RepID=A0A512BG62_9BACT|nr:hypothetical protein [Segetibacter aerophilus]GEO10958.1 hypothetical protein SAE01_34540 [Segetibacter aerophilus]
MEKDQNQTKESPQKEENQKPLPVHNPFDPNDTRKITQEDIDNEERFKEAMTERD